jgi:hypothetical protein
MAEGGMHPSDHVALAFVAAHPARPRRSSHARSIGRRFGRRRASGALERAGLATAELGDGGSFRRRATPAGRSRLAELPRPPFEDVGGPLSRFKR